MRAWYRFLINFFLVTAFVVTTSILKVSHIWGSKAAFFSLANSARPLIGLYGGLPGVFLYLILYLVKAISIGYVFSPFVFHFPTVFSALYWASRSWIIRLAVPLACIILFLAHPVGFQAAFYTSFWLIPLGVYFMPKKGIFLHALASTFIAHAVGSILWLYWIPMNSEMFLSLMPVVIVERLVFATGMTLAYYMFESAKLLLQSIVCHRPSKNSC